MAKCSACGGTGKAKPKESNPNMPKKSKDERHERSLKPRIENKLKKSENEALEKHYRKQDQNKKKKYGY